MPANPAYDVRDSLRESLRKQADNEYFRLRLQHKLILRAMGGKALRVPLPPSPKILDSATSDGLWMVELSKAVPAATFVGTDMEPAHFDKNKDLPSTITFDTQNVFEPWPARHQNVYDLVHQRYLLPSVKPDVAAAAVAGLFGCVKPGGWIQLVEADLSTWRTEGPEHAAGKRMRDFIVRAFDEGGMNAASGPYARGWIEKAGAVNVGEEIVRYELGASDKEPEWAAKGETSIMAMLDMYKHIASNVPNYFFTPGEFDSLKEDMQKELQTVGNEWTVHVVWGQKAA